MRRHIDQSGVPSRTRNNRVSLRLAALALAGVSMVVGSGCTKAQLTGDSPAYLMISNLEAASGLGSQTYTNVLESDVLTKGGVLEDGGRVTFALGLKDPGSAASPAQPSATNFITVNRYHVRFIRADGRDKPENYGVDVPYPFDGAVTMTVNAGGGSANFVLVRVQAKLEAPLRPLRNLGGAIVISTLAEVTFYGQDQAGNPVSVTGNISVNFADWADPS